MNLCVNCGEKQGGWALAELLTVLVLTAFFSSALLQTTLCLQRCLTQWERSARMRQTLSSAMFLMSRDVRMAGCNPMGKATFDGASLVQEGGGAPEELEIRMDKRSSEPGSRPDGDIQDPDEVILYRWDHRHQVLRRNNQPLAVPIVRNPGDVPVFRLTKEFSRGLVRLFLTTGSSDGSLSLSTAICIRNPV